MNVVPDGRVLVVADTSVLLNFAIIGRLHLLTESRYLVHPPNHVIREVRTEPYKARVSAAITAQQLIELEIADRTEIEAYAIYRSRFGDGESAAMAVAVNRLWLIAIDEKGPTRREVIARLGEDHLLTTASILGTAIADGLISANDISAIRDELAANRHLLDHVPGEREEPSSPSRT